MEVREPSMRETEIYDGARAGDLPKVKALLKDQPDLVFSKERAGGTPLHYAAKNGSKDVAELLVAGKADVNGKNRFGETPLLEAARGGHRNVVELLLAHRADVNAKDNDGATPLLWAAKNGHQDVVELLASDSDVNAKNNEGETALHCAARNGYEDVVELLRQHGGDESLKPNIAAHDRLTSMDAF